MSGKLLGKRIHSTNYFIINIVTDCLELMLKRILGPLVWSLAFRFSLRVVKNEKVLICIINDSNFEKYIEWKSFCNTFIAST